MTTQQNDDLPFMSAEDFDKLVPGETAPSASDIVWTDPVDVFAGHSIIDGEMPKGVFPWFVEKFARADGELVGSSEGPIAMAFMTAIAAAIPEGVVIQPKSDYPKWRESPIIWTGITGASGMAKSHPVRVAKASMEDKQKWQAKRFAELQAVHLEMLEEYKDDLKAWKKRKAKDPDTAGERPRGPGPAPGLVQYYVEDINTEKLVEVCSHNTGGVVQLLDEIARLIGSFGAYSGAGTRDQAMYLEAFGGGSYTVQRLSRTLHADRMAVSIFGAITEDALANLFRGKPRDGFMARFLFVQSMPRVGRNGVQDMEMFDRYLRLVEKVRNMEKGNDCLIVKLSPGAEVVRQRMHVLRHAMMKMPYIGNMTKEHLAKWDTFFARFCLIYHIFDNAFHDRDQSKHTLVSEATALQVERLIKEYLYPEAVRVFEEVLGDVVEGSEHRRWIAGWILSRGQERFSMRDLGRDYRKVKLDKPDSVRAIEGAMNELEMLGWIEQRTTDRMRYAFDLAKRKWEVNPAVFERFADRAAAEAAWRNDVKEKIKEAAEVIRNA